jgi:hypothetical protein
MKKNNHKKQYVPKSYTYHGINVLAEGNHMKDESTFVESTKHMWNNDELVARDAYKFITDELAREKKESEPANKTNDGGNPVTIDTES